MVRSDLISVVRHIPCLRNIDKSHVFRSMVKNGLSFISRYLE